MAPRVNIPPATMDVKLTNWPTRDILERFSKYFRAQNLAMTRLDKAQPMASPTQGMVAREEEDKPMSTWEKIVAVYCLGFKSTWAKMVGPK